MLKTFYETQEAIPENLRGAYVQSGGKWALDELSTDHPVILKRTELLSENANQKASIQRLTAEKQSLEGSTLPNGHVAVPLDDAKLIEKVKTHGTSTEIVAKLAEHKTLKESVERQKRDDHLREVAKILSYEPEAFVRLQNLPEFDIREKDGQKTVIAKLKDGSTITEKPASEFIEASADFAPFLPALKADSKGTRVHGSASNGGAPPKDVFTKIRDNAKKESEQAQSDIHPMFRQIPGRVAQA